MRRATRLGWFELGIAVLCANAQLRFAGEVRDANRAPLPGVRISLDCAGPPMQTHSDPLGAFQLDLPAPGACRLTAERSGYYPIRSESIEVAAPASEVALTLEPVRGRVESMDVRAAASAIDMDTSASRSALTSRDLLDIPYPRTNDLRDALRTTPGVTRDARGGLHVNGASEEQALYVLNGFTVNDPLTGKFDSRVSVESVRNVEVTTGNLPAEFGKGSGGALSVETHTGDDRWRPTATNFFPGFENRKGWTIGDWTPRFGLSGPLGRGTTWLSASVDLQYVKTVVRELPAGADRTAARRASSLLHFQHNLTPGHILSGGVLANLATAARTGLTVLDPVETTTDRRARQWFFHGKDRIYFRRGYLVEAGFASNRTFSREIPQGHSFLAFTTQGKRGNSFVDGTRMAGRDQALLNVSLPAMARAGSVLVRFGLDLDRLTYRQDVRRTGFENYSEAGALTLRGVFRGNGRFGRSSAEAAGYLQNAWRVRPGLLIESGARLDWDSLLDKLTPSPRLGVAWAPERSNNTKVYAGFARIADASNLRLFTRPLDQYTLTSHYLLDGSLSRGPALSRFTIANRNIERPISTNWFLGAAHRWQQGVVVRADYVRRRGSRGFTYRNMHDGEQPMDEWVSQAGAAEADAVYNLTNERVDAFDSLSVRVRHDFRARYDWFASYTLSRARSNAVVDVTVEDPVTILDNAGPMPWDAPHRLVAGGYLPTPIPKWAVAFLLDTRTGYPFSVQSDAGVVGGVNSLRFPMFLELGVHVERRFAYRGHNWAWRAGCNNATGRINPDSVNNIQGSSRYLMFHGGTGRSTNFRIRWLGRVAR